MFSARILFICNFCNMKFYGVFFTVFLAFTVQAQTFQREFPLAANGTVSIKNLYGRVSVSVEEAEVEDKKGKVFLTAQTPGKMI